MYEVESKRYQIHIKGVTPLIMNCDKASNPLLPLSKKMKEITAVKKKTDEHHLALSRLGFEAAMYYDKDIGVYMPSKCLQGCIRSAARKYKQGKQTKAVLLDEAIGYQLIPYKGKDIESLYNEVTKSGDRPYVFIENLVVGMSRVLRTRPIFNKWEVKFGLYLDTELLSESNLQMILHTAGREYGLCDLRPGLANGNYGRFEVVEFKEAA